jgi:2-polyprenyl-3-methyl-5-hydroxy-6-metoxy-1,4-benzoquinol methylase
MEKEELKQLLTGYWNYLAVNAACELKLFDILENGAQDIESLLNTHGWNRKAFESLLHICEQEGLLHVGKKIELTAKGRYLVSTNPDGLYHACLLWADEHMNAWQQLSSVIRTGQPSFEIIYRSPFFDYLKSNPEKLRDYHEAMHEYANDDYRDISIHLDLRRTKAILDVGGGFGALIGNIAKAHKDLKCGLFDLPEVIAQVQREDVDLYSGNFFNKLPVGYDTIVMSRIIHDWDDLDSGRILENVHDALPPRGILFLIENLTDRITNHASGLTLNMMAMCKSFERTEAEYLNLLKQNRFGNFQIKQLNTTQYIIQCSKI